MNWPPHTIQLLCSAGTILGVVGVFCYFQKQAEWMVRLSVLLLSAGILGNLAGFATGALPLHPGWAALTLAFGLVPLLFVWGGLSIHNIDPREAELIERIMHNLEDDLR
jgi:hypothetical protein